MSLFGRSEQPRKRVLSLESLERRRLFNASADDVRAALDLPTGTFVSYSGDTDSLCARTLYNTAGLLGFPSGSDADFLMLSSGLASWVDTQPNTSGDQGTDLGAEGAGGDTAQVTIKIPVPDSPLEQKLKFDFMFLSEEYPEWVGSEFNDFFTATVNGENIALDQYGNEVNVNNVYFDGDLGTAGTFLDGRTPLLTGVGTVPAGATSLTIVFSIGDAGDGVYDSAVLLDNLRIEQQQIVYLNFDGQTVTDHFGPGTSVAVESFSPSDIALYQEREEVIREIVAYVRTDFSEYDIAFTTDPADLPANGQYATVLIGGGDGTLVTISDWARWFYDNGDGNLSGGALPSGPLTFDAFEHFINTPPGQEMLGKAAGVDVGNQNLSDLAVVFASRINGGDDPARAVAYAISHELGHNLGLRHVDDPADLMYSDEADGGTFQDKLMNLRPEEISYWAAVGDGATRQNDHAYLNAILGAGDAGSYIATSYKQEALYIQPVYTLLLGKSDMPLYNVTLGTYNPTLPDIGASVLQFDELSNLELGALASLGSDTRIFLTASSTPGGPVDIFLGSPDPTGGWVSGAPMFSRTGQPLTTFTLGQVTPGGEFVPLTTLDVNKSDYTDIVWLTDNHGAFTDQDGDVYTVNLSGPGEIGLFIDDPDRDGRGPIDQIFLRGTDPEQSKLTVSVRPGPAGDGLVDINEIMGSGLKSLNAKQGNLVGHGVFMPGDATIGTLTLNEVRNGADIVMGGAAADQGVSIRANRIDPLSEITLGGGLKALRVDAWYGSGLSAAWVGKITVKGDKYTSSAGDVSADISLSGEGVADGSTTLGTLKIAGNLGGLWYIQGNVGKIQTGGIDALWQASVTGNIKSLTARGDAGGILTAGSARNIVIKGSLEDAVYKFTDDHETETPALAKLKVKYWVDNTRIVSVGDIGSVTLGGLSDSFLFAGVSTPTTALPVDRAVLGGGSEIAKISVKGLSGESFALLDSSIAAWTVGKVKLGDVCTQNDGDSFGLAVVDLTSVKFSANGQKYTWSSKDLPGLPPTAPDFGIHLL